MKKIYKVLLIVLVAFHILMLFIFVSRIHLTCFWEMWLVCSGSSTGPEPRLLYIKNYFEKYVLKVVVVGLGNSS